jgi:hypothetical protein
MYICPQIFLSHPPTAPQNQWTFIRVDESRRPEDEIRNREEKELTDEAPKVIKLEATDPKRLNETLANTAEDRRKAKPAGRKRGRGGKQAVLERDKAEQGMREDAAPRASKGGRLDVEEREQLTREAKLDTKVLEKRLAEERQKMEIERKQREDKVTLSALEKQRREVEKKNRLVEELRQAELKAKELEERLAEERRQAEERRKAEAETRRIEIERKQREDEAALRVEEERREAEQKNRLAEEQRQVELNAKKQEEQLAEAKRQTEAAMRALEEEKEKAEEKKPLAEEQCHAELAVRSQDDAKQREMHVRLVTIVKDRGGDDYRKLLALRGDDAQAMLNHLQAVCFLLHSFMAITHRAHPRLWIPSKLTILRKVH